MTNKEKIINMTIIDFAKFLGYEVNNTEDFANLLCNFFWSYDNCSSMCPVYDQCEKYNNKIKINWNDDGNPSHPDIMENWLNEKC